jgi:triosephosphate isomerase
MHVIFCFGEELEDRKSEAHFDLVTSQLTNGLFHLQPSQWSNIILAYEPVWAIGTGETASPVQAQEMHAHIRAVLAAKYDDSLAQRVSVLYGGSVKPANAKEIFAQTDVDGGLIGGAALNAEDFAAIVNAF